MQIIGIDGGFASSGLVVLDFAGERPKIVFSKVVKTEPNKATRIFRSTDDARRMAENYAEVESVFKTFPEIAAAGVETFSPRSIPREVACQGCGRATTIRTPFADSHKGAFMFGLHLGALLGHLPHGLVFEFHPNALKKWATGNAAASKQDVAGAVRRQLPDAAAFFDKRKTDMEHFYDAACLCFLAKSEYGRYAVGAKKETELFDNPVQANT